MLCAAMAEDTVHLNSPYRDEKKNTEAGATRLTYGDCVNIMNKSNSNKNLEEWEK